MNEPLDHLEDVDDDGIGCLFISAIVAIILALVLGGCASMPNSLPEMPSVQGFAALPNCVTFCTIHVNIQKAASEVTSTGTGAVTGGAQSQSASSSSTQSTSETKSVDKP
jgi:hypothetical protein